MAKIAIDDNSRLISAADLTFSKRGGRDRAPIDFARDHVVILDPATGRPVAECWPIEREAGAEAPKPVLVGVAPAAPRAEGGAGGGQGQMGPLSEAQREQLQRLWMAHPDWTVDKVGEAFERATGRAVSALTVAKYRTEGQEAKGRKG